MYFTILITSILIFTGGYDLDISLQVKHAIFILSIITIVCEFIFLSLHTYQYYYWNDIHKYKKPVVDRKHDW